ncbi:transposable element Tcb2 transposase [Trichonephila clavipes]|nr:transposable element Tcb2 transposase [Trichonephila clavipes]
MVYKGRAEVDMPLRRFRRQYEQLSQFERGRIIGMMEAGWSVRRVARQLGHSDCVVRRCWDQWIQEMSFTRRPGSGRPRPTSRREDRHIVRNARVQPTASSAATRHRVVTLFKGGPPHSLRNAALQRHTAPTAGMMVWGTIEYNTRSPLVLIRGTMTAAVAEWYRHRIVAGFVTSSSPVPLKTRRVGQRCTLNLSRAETSSRWCGVVVRREGCLLRCRPRHLTMVQNYVVRRQKPSCS